MGRPSSILTRAAAPALLLPAAAASAQFNINWYTVDGGGGTSTGGGFTLRGTAGQHDAGVHTGGAFILRGGFWGNGGPPACYANCDNSTQAPVLNVADFGCFLTRYAAGDPYANCDNSTQPPILNVADFGCFLTKYAAGCP